MRFQYAGLVTKNDFLKILFIHNSHLKWRRWVYGAFFLLAMFSIIFSQIRGTIDSEEMKALLPGIFIFLVFTSSPWWSPFLQLMGYSQKGNIYRDHVHGVIDNVEITINGTDVKASFRWPAYTDYKDTKDVLLLYQGKNNFSIFMKNMFSDQNEWETFVAFAKDKVSLNKKRA